jgi:hypothetical protein
MDVFVFNFLIFLYPVLDSPSRLSFTRLWALHGDAHVAHNECKFCSNDGGRTIRTGTGGALSIRMRIRIRKICFILYPCTNSDQNVVNSDI